MRFARFASLLVFLFVKSPAWAQQTPAPASQPQTNTSQQTPPPAPKDPQAVNVLNQALNVAGGTAAILAVTDYTATGNIDYNWNPEAQGTVTILGLGLTNMRVDANLPSGVNSQIVSGGQSTRKAEDGRVSQYPPPYPVPSSDAYPYQPPMFPGGFLFPHAQLLAALNGVPYSISYKGVVQLNGGSVHDVRVQRVMPGQNQADSMSMYHTIDFFIDINTLQLLMTQDNVPKNIVHQIQYSDYRQTGSVQVPFSITETMNGQKTRTIQLGQISFNSGLQVSAFAIQ
jgi:hypothetical protein